MDNQVLTERLQQVIVPVLEDLQAELVELDLVRTSGQIIVRLLVDKLGTRINMDECALINRRLGDIVEEQHIIPDRYVLEVSSPGIDRPLKAKSDFARNSGKLVKIFLREAVSGKIEWDGVIRGVSDTEVSVEIEGQVVLISLSIINKGKLLF
ncbi:MAG: ribosome maturation factor RimP [Candidatus Omnitrophica bacterium]|nr:ribosome maturation factor RimP [Candidatus Omnitrophota bacterium]